MKIFVLYNRTIERKEVIKMKKILSILLASTMLSVPMTASVSAKECGIKKLLEDFSQVYTYQCEITENCNIDISSLAEKLKGLTCILKGYCNGDSLENENGNNEVTTPDGSQNDKTDIPTNDKTDTEITLSQNALANEVIELVNKERAKHGLSAVSYDKGAECAANVRAKETETLFSHTRPNGSRCFSALDECGVSYRGAGENIAMGQSSATEVMNDWMNSEGHRENILNPSFTKLGVGVHKGADGRYYWAQMFIY